MNSGNIDFYTISHRNAKIYYNLDKPNGYYNYFDVLAEAKEVHKDNEEVLKKIEENQLAFDSIMNQRKSRENNLRKQFEAQNIEFIKHSFLVRNHVMYGKNDWKFVVETMYKMKVLFEYCNIKETWEQYKISEGRTFYSPLEKDNFYQSIYEDYLQKNPHYVIQV